jgi:hypothetical protein
LDDPTPARTSAPLLVITNTPNEVDKIFESMTSQIELAMVSVSLEIQDLDVSEVVCTQTWEWEWGLWEARNVGLGGARPFPPAAATAAATTTATTAAATAGGANVDRTWDW